jgi:hypothetical protein
MINNQFAVLVTTKEGRTDVGGLTHAATSKSTAHEDRILHVP